ncbi:uncharacterized protein LOC133525409 [Cydia pomonella]|uniref:uncharacterized protein LOC133525409 n=1 Tax=Cydia pomonella TaxID=82600 RepID=UPI002ADD92D2|nr:uncharacterized protein LOC133525409 [Cydia pomonella]
MLCIPKKFLYKFPLKTGALVFGIITLCLLIICAVTMIIQIVFIKDCPTYESCHPFAMLNCYAYSITGFIYMLVMIAMNLWFFHGIKKKKPSVVLSWLIVYSMWLVLAFVILIILICLHVSEVNKFVNAICALVFGLIAIAILVYGVLVIVGFWMELKTTKHRLSTTA